LGQGKEKARLFLIENPEISSHIRQQVMEALELGGPVASATEDSSDAVAETDS
jgi:recombination protein RecA